jgi:predicted ABC-type ATPase
MNKSFQPRLRMFAGPNGSGKSTMKSVIKSELLGIYVNPDDIEREILKMDFLDLQPYEVKTTREEILTYFDNSVLLKKADLLSEVQELRFSDNKLDFFGVHVNAYFASVAADFIRQKLVETRKSFTFETVMSSPDKIDLLKKAKEVGFRTYLYYVATEDPDINVSRVKHRVKTGGHNVPKDKIIQRYYRSLDLLIPAIKQTDRAYIFDNSGTELSWLAAITDANTLEIKSKFVPTWFRQYVLDKI